MGIKLVKAVMSVERLERNPLVESEPKLAQQTRQAAEVYLGSARQTLESLVLADWCHENSGTVVDFLSERTF